MVGHQEHGEQHACGCGQRHLGPHHSDWMGQGGCCGSHHARGPACGGHTAPFGREGTSWRRFATREEQIARLERYLQDLRAEAQAVEERIADMKAKA